MHVYSSWYACLCADWTTGVVCACLTHCAVATELRRPGAVAGLTASSLLYDVVLPESGAPFNLKVTRKATGEAIFDTTGHQ
jgi:hypothetical protein